jgi:hypothetical protein
MARLFFLMVPVNAGEGLGLVTFGDLPAAEQYVRDCRRPELVPKKLKEMKLVLPQFKQSYPPLTHVIVDPTFRTAS